jgi:ATP-dependent RNA helicase RhlE
MPSVLVFTRTKHSARKLTRIIAADGFKVAELHGNRTQGQRTRAMDGFRRGDYQVIIAARGLDVQHITHVISYDVPPVPEDYIHRVGRTARTEAEGDAYVLVSPPEEASLVQIERQIGQRLPRITLADFDYLQSVNQRPRGHSHFEGQKQNSRSDPGSHKHGRQSRRQGGRRRR